MGRKTNDLTGQRFGRLTVIKYLESRNKRRYWLCKCACGNTTIVSTTNLRSENTKSCGCLEKIEPNRASHLEGIRFGKLKVIERTASFNKRTCWICKCDCGNTCIKSSSYLWKAGDKSNCGCLCKEVYKKSALKRIEDNDIGIFKHTNISRIKSSKLCKNNSSGHTGVYFIKNRQKWKAEISVQQKTIYLGYFDNLEDAIRARKEAEEKYFQPLIEEYEKSDSQ